MIECGQFHGNSPYTIYAMCIVNRDVHTKLNFNLQYTQQQNEKMKIQFKIISSNISLLLISYVCRHLLTKDHFFTTKKNQKKS